MDLGQFVEKAGPMRALGVVVSQNGKEIGRYLWEGACRRNIYSASKSFTSAAVGIAQKEGLLSIDEKLVDAFPDDLPETVSDYQATLELSDQLARLNAQNDDQLAQWAELSEAVETAQEELSLNL